MSVLLSRSEKSSLKLTSLGAAARHQAKGEVKVFGVIAKTKNNNSFILLRQLAVEQAQTEAYGSA
jgi:hypothetical protein